MLKRSIALLRLPRLLSIHQSFKSTSHPLTTPFVRPTVNLRFAFTSSSDPTQVALLEEVEAKVLQVVQFGRKFNQKAFNEKGKSATFEELGYDSLDSVELVVAMEEHFGINLQEKEAEKVTTVETAINTFFRHLNEQIANKIVETEQPKKE